jgi:VanZ family protein
LLIVYGSLYPWRFREPPGSLGPIEILLRSRSGLIYLHDFFVNIALYIPLGACAYLTLKRPSRKLRSLVMPVLLGIALSTTLELIQVYEASRKSSIYDVMANTIGSVIGVVAGSMFAATSKRLRATHAGSLAILGCWVAYLCFPFVFVFEPRLLAAKFSVLLRSGSFALIPVVSALASWYAAGLLFMEAGFRNPKRWLIASLALIPLKLFVVGRQPLIWQWIGAVAGVALFSALGPSRPGWAPAALLVALFIRGLAPFHFQPAASGFGWIPFVGTLDSDWQSATLTLLEKLFYYSATIWSLRAAGFRLPSATALVAAALLAIELFQRHLPGRSPEITDPILALLIGFGLESFKRTSSPSGTSA